MKAWLMRANLFLESLEKAVTDVRVVDPAVAAEMTVVAEKMVVAEKTVADHRATDQSVKVKAEAVETDSEDHVVEEEVELVSQVVILFLQQVAESNLEVVIPEVENSEAVISEAAEAASEVDSAVEEVETEVDLEEKKVVTLDLLLDPDNTKDTLLTEVVISEVETEAAAEVAQDLPTDPSENFLLNLKWFKNSIDSFLIRLC